MCHINVYFNLREREREGKERERENLIKKSTENT